MDDNCVSLIITKPSHLPPGPKGVINDWRKFKLESMDQESFPPNKRELLKQMSSPHKPKEESLCTSSQKVGLSFPGFSYSNKILKMDIVGNTEIWVDIRGNDYFLIIKNDNSTKLQKNSWGLV